MASKGKRVRGLSQRFTTFTQRLVYDVMVFTLPKFGFPETKLPPVDCKGNVYRRVDFLKIACASTMRISLILRDRWERIFTSRFRSSGFNEENISSFFEMVIVLIPLSWSNTIQSIVNTSLAFCNEMILFLHHKEIDIDPKFVMNLVGAYIARYTLKDSNSFEAIEYLFDQFQDVSDYLDWITAYIAEFAIPYKSADVSDQFFQCFKDEWMEIFKASEVSQTKVTVKDLRNFVGFLPNDFFEAIAYEVNAVCSEQFAVPAIINLAADSASSFGSDEKKSHGRHGTLSKRTSGELSPLQENSETEESDPISQSESLEKSESSFQTDETGARRKNRSRKVSEPITQGQDCGEKSLELEIENEPDRMNLCPEKVSTESHDLQILHDETPKPHADSKTGIDVEESSGSRRDTPSKKACEQSSTNPSESGIEDNLRQLSLDTETVSQKSQGAIPKKRF